MKDSDFRIIEALLIDTNLRYVVVVSCSVFHYFKGLNYAKDVLIRMIQKANKKIGIFDINDKSKEEKYHQVRRGNMNEENMMG